MKSSLMFIVTICALVVAAFSDDYAKSLSAGEGFVDVPGGKVWYRIVGSGEKTPLLVVHGGPGIPAYYLKPLAGLSVDRPVIFFDQLGCGHSQCPNDTAQWVLQKFVDEIPAIRKTLGLKKIHLYGHSWGTMLATDYLLTRPSGVISCIMAGPALSIPLWLKGTDSLLGTLPDSIQQVIKKCEAARTFDAPEYQNALMSFYQLYVARKLPWSADIDSSFAGMNNAMYNYMQGASEFTITGTLKDYDRTRQLDQIRVPTLIVVGEFDESVPANAKKYQSLIPGAKLEIIPHAGHLAMQDDSATYVDAIRVFLDSVDNATNVPR